MTWDVSTAELIRIEREVIQRVSWNSLLTQCTHKKGRSGGCAHLNADAYAHVCGCHLPAHMDTTTLTDSTA